MRGKLTEKMAVDLVSQFIPFILGNTGVDTTTIHAPNLLTYCSAEQEEQGVRFLVN